MKFSLKAKPGSTHQFLGLQHSNAKNNLCGSSPGGSGTLLLLPVDNIFSNSQEARSTGRLSLADWKAQQDKEWQR